MLARLHVDEVEDHESADVPQAQLAGDFLDGLQIHLADRILLAALALVVPRVDVHRNERLRLVDDEIAAGLERDLTGERVLQLAFDAIVVEDAGIAVKAVDPRARPARDARGELAHRLIRRRIVDDDRVHVFRQPVADHALAEVGLLEDAARRTEVLHVPLHLVPHGYEVAEIAREGAGGRALPHGAHDKAAVLGERQPVEDLLQALALVSVTDLLRHAADLRARHHHQIAPRNRQVRRHARTLRGDRTLRDLNDDLGSRRKALGDLGVRQAVRLAPALLLLLLVVVIVQERVRIRRHVPIVEKRVLLQPDVDERRLQIVLQVLHASLEDAPDQPLLLRMLDHELLEPAILQNGYARLEFLDVDDDLALHLRALEPTEQIDHFLFSSL